MASAAVLHEFLHGVTDFIASSSFHIVVESALLCTILVLLLQRSFKPQKKPLTEEEIDALCAEWQPEPLVPPLTEAQLAFKEPVLLGCVCTPRRWPTAVPLLVLPKTPR